MAVQMTRDPVPAGQVRLHWAGAVGGPCPVCGKPASHEERYRADPVTPRFCRRLWFLLDRYGPCGCLLSRLVRRPENAQA